MIEIQRTAAAMPSAFTPLAMKIIGVGGAGCSVIDRLLIDGVPATDLVAVNTDLQALSSTVAAQKVQLGYSLTHGLGAGGDPEVGMAAAQDALDELRAVANGSRLVFIAAGLGGGTGSGAAPFMAHAAREEGAVVIGIVTLPFAFEGRRRLQQAQVSLDQMRQLCHAVICFENDRMSELVAPNAGIQQAFLAADQTMSECIRGILAMLERPGIMKVGVDDLLTVLRSDDPRCLFGHGESEGENRCHEALAFALRNPLMERGRLLENTANVLVHVAGSSNLTLAEIEILMGELNRHIGDSTQILLGATIDPRLGQRLTVTLVSTLGNPLRPLFQQAQAAMIIPAETEPLEVMMLDMDDDPARPLPEDASQEPVKPRSTPAAPVNRAPRAPQPANKPESPALDKPAQVKQETLQFEPVSRGRFEKSEPTIIEGHDLDIPTVLRKGFRV